MYDAYLPTTVQTEIQQLADQIALRATVTEVNALGEEVEAFGAELTIQAQQIQSAVSSVNAKTATYVMMVDPRTAYTVTIGDTWILSDGVLNWQDVADEYSTWNEVLETYGTWLEILGSKTFVWNGNDWIETSDRASEVWQKTLIDQNAVSISLIAETTAVLEGEVYNLNALFVVANNAITAEVSRATTAEGGKLDKTSSYQTADSIVTAANNWITGKLQDSSWVSQTATGISAYVSSNFYGIKSGIDILAAGIEISGAKYVKIKSGGQFLVDSGNFSIDTSGNVTVKGTVQAAANSVIGGWTLGATDLHAGTGTNYVALSSAGTYAMWAGAESATNAPWRVKRDGSQVITKLLTLNESGTEIDYNLRSAALWKLNYQVIKSVSSSGGYVTSMTLSNGDTVNFNSAASVYTETAEENGGLVGPGVIYVMTTLSNGREEMLAVASPLHDAAVQNAVSATIGSWSNGRTKVTLSNPNATEYYVDMPSTGSWSRTAGVLGETVTFICGGNTYSHYFAN